MNIKLKPASLTALSDLIQKMHTTDKEIKYLSNLNDQTKKEYTNLVNAIAEMNDVDLIGKMFNVNFQIGTLECKEIPSENNEIED